MKRFATILLLLLILSGAQALTLATEMNKQVYRPGELAKADVTVINTGSEDAYAIEYWIADEHFVMNTRYIQKGSNSIEIFFYAPEKSGFFDFQVKLSKPQYSITKHTDFAVSPKTQGFLIDISPEVIVAQQEGEVMLKIANLGSYEDLYQILLPKMFIEKTHEYVTVLPEGMVFVPLAFDMSDKKSGRYDINLSICSLTYWRCLDVSSIVLVNRSESEETEVYAPEEGLQIAVNKKKQFSVFVKNTSPFQKTIAMKLKPVNFSGSYGEMVSVESKPGEGHELSLGISPNQTGAYSMEYLVYSNGVEIMRETMNITSYGNMLSGAFFTGGKFGWAYALVAVCLVFGIILFFVKYKPEKVKYPYFK